ncbi:glycosyltransferase family 4 protein [Vibrio sp. 03-59-1]|uniref:glycosyltransferase n=1 Tax=Vibrio sp. 03-59-1 TaxID=2607607 RepID=UPI0014938B0B|nr:glycosyltransferase [Vibrio sp. 03-59-1]NOH84527.1 glycosyltransferase family 4 protein [Vibrio sp. 03-59-1]
MSKNIIVYDFFAAQGGAEFFTKKVAELFKADIATGYIDSNQFDTSTLESFNVRNLDLFTGNNVIRYFNLNFGFSRFGHKSSQYENIILSGNHALSAASTIKNANVIYYCHTIPRFAYDLYDYYFCKMGLLKKIQFYFFCKYIRWNFNRNIKYVDKFICNSNNVKKRIKVHTGHDAEVIYPPVDIQDYTFIKQGDYYLSTARLEDHKRVELIVKAFISMPDKKLVVASGGTLLEPLKELAKNSSNIYFTDWIKKERLVELMGECIASIYIPIDEDFGISPVESMAAGKPVIGVNEGGLKETIIHNETGYLCDTDLKISSLCDAVEYLNPERALLMKEQCITNSHCFSVENFTDDFDSILPK